MRLAMAASLALAALGCEVGEAICRCLADACADDVCGRAIRIAGDHELHRIDPAHGRTTVCGIELEPDDETVDGHEAEDELRAGAGHGPCWRTKD